MIIFNFIYLCTALKCSIKISQLNISIQCNDKQKNKTIKVTINFPHNREQTTNSPYEEQLKYPINLSTVYRFGHKAINYQFCTNILLVEWPQNCVAFKTFVECATNSCVLQPHTHTLTHILHELLSVSHTRACKWTSCVCVVSYFLWTGCNNRKHQQDAILMSQARHRQPELLRNKRGRFRNSIADVTRIEFQNRFNTPLCPGSA